MYLHTMNVSQVVTMLKDMNCHNMANVVENQNINGTALYSIPPAIWEILATLYHIEAEIETLRAYLQMARATMPLPAPIIIYTQNNIDDAVTINQNHQVNIQNPPQIEGGYECGVCYQNFDHSQMTLVCENNHVLCIDCMMTWNIYNSICPYCRQAIL